MQLLNKLLELKLINFNEGKINFNSKYYLVMGRQGIWTEDYWYWFGWWKLCLGTDVCSILTSADQSLVGFAGALIEKGLAAPIAYMAAPFLIANWLVLKIFDKGNGVWIGILWDAPGMDLGSN